MRGGSEPVEISVFVHLERGASLLVSEFGERDESGRVKDGVFLPLEKVCFEDAEEERKLDRWRASPMHRRGTVVVTLSVPEWLAHDRGLI